MSDNVSKTDRLRLFTNVQQDFARILALINQVSELQQNLTPENIDLLQQDIFPPKNN